MILEKRGILICAVDDVPLRDCEIRLGLGAIIIGNLGDGLTDRRVVRGWFYRLRLFPHPARDPGPRQADERGPQRDKDQDPDKNLDSIPKSIAASASIHFSPISCLAQSR